MRRSANELQSLLFKACIGANVSTGLAQDCSRAALRLSQLGQDGASALLDALYYMIAHPNLPGLEFKESTQIKVDNFCVVRQSAAIFDIAAVSSTVQSATMDHTSSPMLLVGMAKVFASDYNLSIDLKHADRLFAKATPHTMELMGKLPLPSQKIIIQCNKNKLTDPRIEKITSPILVAEIIWNQLLELAKNTYVPATKASREVGAGAGLSDND